MTMKIYGTAGSTCTERVLFTLGEKGHEAELVFVNLASGAHKKAEHLARHPFGVIPVLEDDDFRLYESRAIIRYLDDRFPSPSLTPVDAKDRARMAQWMSVEQSYLTGGGTVRRNLVYGRFIGLTPNMEEVESAKVSLGATLDVVEKGLEGKDWLAGSFSLAEVAFMPELDSFAALPAVADVITSRPNVKAWFERIRNRPGWQRVIKHKHDAAAAFARTVLQP
jgi:glutathione S-transferase